MTIGNDVATADARSVADITKEAGEFDYSNAIRLRNWLRTARQIRQQAEIYESEGNVQQAYLLYYRQAVLVLEHLSGHPEVKASAANKALLRAAKADVEISLGRLEQLKPLVEREHSSSLKRQEEAAQRRRADAERLASLKTSSRPLSGSHQYDSRPSSASYEHSPYTSYYDGYKNPELALQVAHQAQGIPESLRVNNQRRTSRPERRGDDDYNLAQGMQNIRLQLEGKPQQQQRQQHQLSRPQHQNARQHSYDRTEYPSVPAARAADSGHEQVQRSDRWLVDPNSPRNSLAPSRPEKLPVQASINAPLRPPKEGYDNGSSSDHRLVTLPPSLPPKTPPAEASAPPPPVPAPAPHSQQVFKPSAFLENGVPLRSVFFPPALRRDFLRLAQANTAKKVETCGILCGFLKNNALFISSLVVPEQTSTSDTCEMTDEGEIALFDWVDSRHLLTLGWIHTHPTQTCFMSSRDLHTHCGYQSMIQESIAVVCAPSIKRPNGDPDYGIFRLTEPPGMGCIRNCHDTRVFHPHEADNIYTDCQRPGHVVELEGLSYQVHDLRK